MSEKLQIIIDAYPDTEFLSADGFEDAIIGVVGDKLAYSITKCIDILIKRDHMSKGDALDYFYYNVEGAYIGEKTPIWVDDLMICE